MSLYKSLTPFATNENIRLLSTTPHSPFYLPGSRKAPPTLSLTNAVASCAGVCSVMATDVAFAKNIIPFPTISVPFPTSDEPECASLLCAAGLNTPRPRVGPRASQVELRHRRSRARLAQSPLARKEGQRGRSKSPDLTACIGKRGTAADAQLLATVYRTVTSHLGFMEQPFSDLPLCGEGTREVMEAQERLLVQRLSESMVELGCSPFPIVNGPAEDQESSTTLEYPPQADRIRDSPPPPPSSNLAPPVLTMPQLVAKLLLRYGERARRRAVSRARPPGGDRRGDGPATKSSPLAMSVDI